MTANERRMEILDVLLCRRKVTISELQNEFCISRSTAKRDIIELSCSYPITTVPGVGGGIRIAEGYYLGRKYLSAEQEDLLERLSGTLAKCDLTSVRISVTKKSRRPSRGICNSST